MKEERELEAWAHSELRSLPPRRAPEELIVRVRRALAEREHASERSRVAPWSRRSRIIAAILCVLSFIGFCWFASSNPAFANWPASMRHLFASVTEGAGGVLALLDAVMLVLRKVGQPALLGGLLVFAAIGAFCAGVGTVCFRFVTMEKEI